MENSSFSEEAIYEGFVFEIPVYLYVWPILVLFTCACNIVVIIVLLRRKMRNQTNAILVAIAVTDSLTGLVTIPSYIMVFTRWEDPGEYEDDMDYHLELSYSTNDSYYDDKADYSDIEPKPAYILTPELCRFYMISKFFVAMVFHTMSIWMTLFLAIQRFVYVRFPFKAKILFTIKKTVIFCAVICALAPFLHVYQLTDDKVSRNLLCEWRLAPGCEDGGCVYLWLSFFLKQFVPCVFLVAFSVMLIFNLREATDKVARMDAASTTGGVQQRQQENRRVTAVVIVIVVLFLIPEFPYGAFLLYAAICNTFGREMVLETNRAIHAAYEIALVLSFHANFWVYLVFNQRFRGELKQVFKEISMCRSRIRWHLSSVRTTNQQMELSNLNSAK